MKPLILGIAGGTGSGKSTVARRVAEALHGASVISLDMDAYYKNLTHLTLEQRRHINWDHPDAFDFESCSRTSTRSVTGGRSTSRCTITSATCARRARCASSRRTSS